ncbi:hypothetical protein DICSQDRAFT_131768 [Dichomitus squalens LYAD-421 SS1]|uniref:uncharacterized protein n=1 Tax=Dichomitus squalens (strain LYAD-421) TaxID=732165 RepID=UPI0004414AFB|nr:uncharacterized protein DICSQDRAFT_131768 [Dichomitus squalens LYAD-421 SS1]EJF67435.1 hypothetical protein DICSQDRAFT_131768 [Dichomitus squalens LYAD-421 SS1]
MRLMKGGPNVGANALCAVRSSNTRSSVPTQRHGLKIGLTGQDAVAGGHMATWYYPPVREIPSACRGAGWTTSARKR